MKTAITIKKTYETVANERAEICARELCYTDARKDAFIEGFVYGYALGFAEAKIKLFLEGILNLPDAAKVLGCEPKDLLFISINYCNGKSIDEIVDPIYG